MILPNHPRLRFALKVVLAVTAPVWGLALIPVVFVGSIGWCFWLAASDIVDRPPRYRGGKVAP